MILGVFFIYVSKNMVGTVLITNTVKTGAAKNVCAVFIVMQKISKWLSKFDMIGNYNLGWKTYYVWNIIGAFILMF